MACKECDNERCPGVDKLRHFATWDDLSSHLSESLILEAVNGFVEIKEAKRMSGQKYRRKQQLIKAKLAEKFLDRDELERIDRLVKERLDDSER